MENNKIDIKSLSEKELTELIVSFGEKPFRAQQIFTWLHQKNVRTLEEMTNISKKLRSIFEEKCMFTTLNAVEILTSQIDQTKKFLFSLEDGNIIESVWMKYKHGNSVCISSQVGCRMGCKFCASTLDGLVRNLTPAEMLEQIYCIQRETKERVSNVVIMGSGEPFDNYENLLKFIYLLSNENGLHISQRNITVSTCGLIDKIKKLADEKLQITLAISLHGATQEKRQSLMPVANKYKLKDLIEACNYYFLETKRRLTFEYSLIEGENDSWQDAKNLCETIKGINCHVNLIPVNPIKERNYKQSQKEAINNFKNKLENNGINVTIRREMGRDIEGACGQLRKRFLER